MNAVPKREASTRHPGATSLSEALRQQAQAKSHEQLLRENIEHARAVGAEEFEFAWQTNDDREAELRIYFTPAGEGEILAVELISLDFRPPTSSERRQYETSFHAELATRAELWSRVASHIWERSARS